MRSHFQQWEECLSGGRRVDVSDQVRGCFRCPLEKDGLGLGSSGSRREGKKMGLRAVCTIWQ